MPGFFTSPGCSLVGATLLPWLDGTIYGSAPERESHRGSLRSLADRFGISRTLVRIGFVFFGLFGVGELVYIALWIIIPKAP